MLTSSAMPLRLPLRSEPSAGRSPLAAIAVIAIIAVLFAVMLGKFAGSAWALKLDDSDNFMRLAEVRDWLGGQSWWDVRQYRVDPPDGLYTHWSRLADLPLAAGIVGLRPFMAAATAERLALVVVPLVLLIVTFAFQRAVAVAIGGRAAALPAVLVAAMSGMLVQFIPGRVDHHGLQILLVLGAMAGLIAAPPRRGAALAALAVAVSLNVGLETAPYLALIAVFVAADWAWRGEAVTAQVFGLGVAAGVPLLFALTVPIAYWSMPKGDAIGRAHVIAAVIGGVGLAGLAAFGGARPGRLARLAVFGAVLAGIVVFAFPEVFTAPYAMVGPFLAHEWMSHIQEMRTVFDDAHDSLWSAAAREFFIVVAAVAALREALRPGSQQRNAALLATLTGGGLLLSGWELRAVPLAVGAAVPVAGVVLGRLWQRRLTGSLLPFTLALAVFSDMPAAVLIKLGERATRDRPIPDVPCNTPAALASLAAAPRGLILAPIDKGGSILALTPQSIVASAIHRDVHGNQFAYRFFLAPPAAARPMLAGSGVTYVGLCPGDAETVTLTREAPNGLLAQLAHGRVPPWLIRAGSTTSPFRFYRVIAGAASVR